MQKHRHRAEHWVVVCGLVSVTKEKETILLNENRSTDIPYGGIYALGSPGKAPLELIEVQSGGYLGEDYIARLEENYGQA